MAGLKDMNLDNFVADRILLLLVEPLGTQDYRRISF